VFELDVVGLGQEPGSGICEINTEECRIWGFHSI